MPRRWFPSFLGASSGRIRLRLPSGLGMRMSGILQRTSVRSDSLSPPSNDFGTDFNRLKVNAVVYDTLQESSSVHGFVRLFDSVVDHQTV